MPATVPSPVDPSFTNLKADAKGKLQLKILKGSISTEPLTS